LEADSGAVSRLGVVVYLRVAAGDPGGTVLLFTLNGALAVPKTKSDPRRTAEKRRTVVTSNPDIAKRVEVAAATYVSWRSLWLGFEDQSGIDVPLDVKWWLQSSK
jgi:hypothetical protein